MQSNAENQNGVVKYYQIPERYLREITETHECMDKLIMHTSDLVKVTREIHTVLLSAATGRNHIDKETFQMTVKMLHKIYGGIIGALLFALVFIVTGVKLGVFNFMTQ